MSSHGRAALLLALVLLVAVAATLATPLPLPVNGAGSSGHTELISLSSSGVQADGPSEETAISADGRYVAFSSTSTNLLSSPLPSGTREVYARDRVTGTTEIVSVDSRGAPATGGAGASNANSPTISADGRYVAFASAAPNLTNRASNLTTDIFVHDRQTRATQLAGVDENGNQFEFFSFQPVMSADGRSVAWTSEVRTAPGSSSVQYKVYIRNLVSGTTRVASLDNNGNPPDPSLGFADASQPALNADGRDVAFVASQALAPGAPPGGGVYVRDMLAGTTEFIHAGGQPSLSRDGRYVAYYQLDPAAAFCGSCGYVNHLVDRLTGQVELVSQDTSGAELTVDLGSNASNTSISTDGRFITFVAFRSASCGDSCLAVFVRDRTSRTTELISMNDAGVPANAGSGAPSLSADGRFVAFGSFADNLVAADTNSAPDAFVRDRCPDGSCVGTPGPVAMAAQPGSDGIHGGNYGYVVGLDAQGQFVRNLSAQPGAFGSPTWSPDGSMLAFDETTLDPHTNTNAAIVHIIRADGSSVADIPESSFGAHNVGIGQSIRWDPTSTRIAYGANYDVQNYNGLAHLIVYDTSSHTRVDITNQIGLAVDNVDWSSRNQIGFNCWNSAMSYMHYCVINPDGTLVAQAPMVEDQYGMPFSPDGRFILHLGATGVPGSGEVEVYDANSLNLLASAPLADSWSAWAAWAPDGASFLTVGGSEGTQLFAFDGTTITRVSSAGMFGALRAQPWSPAGDKVAINEGGGYTDTSVWSVPGFQRIIGPLNLGAIAWCPVSTCGAASTPPTLDLARSTLSISPSSLPGNCPSSSSTATVTLVDTNGQPYTQPTQVAISSSRGATDTIGGSPTTTSSGTATFSICSDTPGKAALSATAGGQALTNTASLTFTVLPNGAALISTTNVSRGYNQVWRAARHYHDRTIDRVAAPSQSSTCPVKIGTNRSDSPIAGYSFNDRPKYPEFGSGITALHPSCPPNPDFVLLEANGPLSPVPLPPVLLVPGFGGMAEGTWQDLAHDLSSQFHVYAIQFSYPHGSMEPKAQALADAIDIISGENGGQKVALVAHSDGGLISRYYVQGLTRTGYLGDVSKMVFLATPNGGVDYPFRDPIASAVADLAAGPLPQAYSASDTSHAVTNGQWMMGEESMHDMPQHVIGADGGPNAYLGSFISCIYHDTDPSHVCSYYSGVTTIHNAIVGGIAKAVADGGGFIDYLNSHGSIPTGMPRWEIYGLKKCYLWGLLNRIAGSCAADYTDGLVFRDSAIFGNDVTGPWSGTFAEQGSNHTSITHDPCPRAQVVTLLGGTPERSLRRRCH